MDFYGINTKDTITADGAPDLGESGSPFTTLYGEATYAQWGDLAEKYKTKEAYDPGTVICVSSNPKSKSFCKDSFLNSSSSEVS